MDLGVPAVVALIELSFVAKNELLVDTLFVLFCFISTLISLSCIDCSRCKFSNTIPSHGI